MKNSYKKTQKLSRKQKIGLPPGSLIYIGNKSHSAQPNIECISYNLLEYKKKTVHSAKEAIEAINKEYFTWINVSSLSNIKEIATLGKYASIHNLFLEDILDTTHRPKIEILNENILLIIKMLSYIDNKLNIEHIAFILGENYLISFQENEHDIFGNIRTLLKEDDSVLRKKGIDYLLLSLMDVIVDHYFIILENLTDEIETFEDKIIENPKNDMISDIQDLKREAMTIRRNIYPLREVISKLEKTPHAIINEETSNYFRDLYEHTVHIVENLDTYHDMLLGLMDMYMSSMSNKMNNIMKVLTIMSTIFIPMTFIAGVYGMNFTNMPFLKNPYGYHITWVIMVGLAIIMLIYYKHKKWI